MRMLAAAVVFAIAGCSDVLGFETLTFWQEVRDAPGVESDPYSGNPSCGLIDEEWRLILADPSDVSSGTFCVKRRYLCAVGST